MLWRDNFPTPCCQIELEDVRKISLLETIHEIERTLMRIRLRIRVRLLTLTIAPAAPHKP